MVLPDYETAAMWTERLAETYYSRFGSSISVATPARRDKGRLTFIEDLLDVARAQSDCAAPLKAATELKGLATHDHNTKQRGPKPGPLLLPSS